MRRRGQAERATVYKLCSLALQYPDDELVAGRAQLAAVAAGLADEPQAASLGHFFTWFTSAAALELERHPPKRIYGCNLRPRMLPEMRQAPAIDPADRGRSASG